jgi:hypothetical protein
MEQESELISFDWNSKKQTNAEDFDAPAMMNVEIVQRRTPMKEVEFRDQTGIHIDNHILSIILAV